jgi:hypothetical protein
MKQSVTLWKAHLAKCWRTHHLVSDQTIELQGDSASATSRVTPLYIQIRENESYNFLIVSGSNDDELVRTPVG